MFCRLSVTENLYYITDSLSIVMPVRFTQEIFLEEYEEGELDPKSRELIRQARSASKQAYAPYSGFKVGAAVMLEDDRIVVGNNQENAAYPTGLCAERVALFAASSQFPGTSFHKIAISARTNHQKPVEVTPCGACRQAMMEYQNLQNTPLEVLMEGANGKIYRAQNVDVLLPFKFSLKV